MDGAMQCKEYIAKKGVIAQHRIFDENVHTAQAAADLLGVSIEQIVKTVILKTGMTFVACILKGADKVDLGRMRQLVGTGDVRVATPDEVLAATGYPVGGVPPFGHGLTVYIDADVMMLSPVHAGGGSDRALVTLTTDELLRVTRGIVVALAVRKA